MLGIFAKKVFRILEEFFPERRGEYFFQGKEKSSDSPFSIDPAISRSDTQLFMRLLFDAGESTDVTVENLPCLMLKYYEEVNKCRALLSLKFYLPVKNNN